MCNNDNVLEENHTLSQITELPSIGGVHTSVESILNEPRGIGDRHQEIYQEGKPIDETIALKDLRDFTIMVEAFGRATHNLDLIRISELLREKSLYIGPEQFDFALDVFAQEINVDIKSGKEIRLYVPPLGFANGDYLDLNLTSNLFVVVETVKKLIAMGADLSKLKIGNNHDAIPTGSVVYYLDDFMLSGNQINEGIRHIVSAMNPYGKDPQELTDSIKIRIIAGRNIKPETLNVNIQDGAGGTITEQVNSLKIAFETEEDVGFNDEIPEFRDNAYPMVFGFHAGSDHGFNNAIAVAVITIGEEWGSMSTSEKFLLAKQIPLSQSKRLLLHTLEPDGNRYLKPYFYMADKLYKFKGKGNPKVRQYWEDLVQLEKQGLFADRVRQDVLTIIEENRKR